MTTEKAAQFTKLVATKSVHLEWTTKRKTASQAEELHHHELDCIEKPRPAFDTALQAFLPFLLQIIGAPVTWAENTRVTGVSLNKEEDGRRGIVITATRKCPYGAAPIALNTPHLREGVDAAKESGNNFMLPGMIELVETLEGEGQAYLDGDRAQGELFESTAKKPSTGKRGGEPTKVGDVLSSIAPEAVAP